MNDNTRRWLPVVNILAGLAIIAGVVVFTGWGSWEGAWQTLTDVYAAAWVLGLLVGGLWISFGPVTPWRALAALWRRGPIVAEAHTIHIMVFDRAYILSWAGGLIGVLYGFTQTTRNLDDPQYLGGLLGYVFLPALYGAMLAEFLFAPLRQVLANRAVAEKLDLPVPLGPSRSVVGVGVGVAFAIAAVIFLILLTMYPRR